MDYVTINSAGNATDFGDLSAPAITLSAVSNGTDDRGVFHLGRTNTSSSVKLETCEYITISSAGNSADFGDLTVARFYGGDMGSNAD